MLTKEQYIAKEIELTAAYEAADKAFDKNTRAKKQQQHSLTVVRL